MKTLLTTLTILLIATASYAQNYVVERVLDGDTIAVITPIGTFEKVRMIGILTPKSNSSDKGEGDEDDATLFVKGLIRPGQYIRLRFDSQERDHDGRLLAYVYYLLGSTKDYANYMQIPEYYEVSLEEKEFNIHGYYFNFLNATIIKAGYATPMPFPPNVKYAGRFKKLYEEAREQKRGLWKNETKMGENRTYENKLDEFYIELDELRSEDFSDEEKTFDVFKKLGEAMSDKIIEMQYDEEGNLISNEDEEE